MNHYNTYLSDLREKKGLTLKEASKQIGISRLSLYLYENGYFRPSKKNLAKLNDFYKVDISLKGMEAYPVPTKEKEISKEKQSLKVKRIVFGAISAAMLTSVLVGVAMFNKSVNNTDSYYGETYNELEAKVNETGELGHDLVTSLPFHYITQEKGNSYASLIFYETDNILYFNECTYSVSALDTSTTDLGLIRCHYQFGSNLGVSSYQCEFNLVSWTKGTYITCIFYYDGTDTVDKVESYIVNVKGYASISEEQTLVHINNFLPTAHKLFNEMMSGALGKDVDFYNNFLHDREQGRVTNFALQIVGLLLMIPGIIVFFIFFALFIRALIANIKPRLVTTEPEGNPRKKAKLPEDVNVRFGIPDIFIVTLAKVMQYGSMVLMLLSFMAKLGLPLPAFLAEEIFLTIMKNALLIGVFLEHFVMIGRIKNATTLFKEIIYNLGVFLFVATIETVLISITNAWGYDFAHLIFGYVPSNIYQVVAVHYLIFLFLFFQPAFLEKKGYKARIIWHSLAILPLGFLIASYIISNRYALVYGVKENIFINFWFPNGFLALSIVSLVFMFLTFAIRLVCEKRFGRHNAQIFFYGDRYSMFENITCSIIIVLVALIDLLFLKNQHAHYIGIGSNAWILVLVPLIIFCKYSPNNQQVFLIEKELPSRQS